ncbi:hypothetical protein EJB05_23170 [Eragrostis curvula]|uniref:Uncharacterized protein n=1 Tax=Eragrostis curvula TaxID=38414 RepID=A0A5J9V6B7_9POAL|nr:hypothetical protein EJB05_23170 [Eragrostis curvula]
MKGLRAMGMVAAEDQATLRYSSDALQAALKDSQDTAAALAALFCFTFLLGLRVDDSTARTTTPGVPTYGDADAF